MRHPVRLFGLGLGAGLFAGSLVGALEAVYVLQATTPAEYQAFGYAWTLYGLLGGAFGLVVAVAGWPVLRLASTAVAWCVSFVTVAFAFGFVLTHHRLDRALYAESGVPLGTSVGLFLGAVIVALVGVWFGANILTKTPLRAVTTVRGNVAAWLGGSALAWLFGLSPAPAPAESRGGAPGEVAGRPDLVLVVVDSLRADALGAYGPPGNTPNLDRLAAESVVFEQAISAASWTRPAIASLFTSQAVSTHHCARADDPLPPGALTLAELLSDRGYATVGLPDSPSVTGAQGFGQGFEEYPFDPDFPLGASESTYALIGYRGLLMLREKAGVPRRVERYYRPADWQVHSGLSRLGAHIGTPTFLFLHLMEPHEPWFSHPDDGTLYARAEHPFPGADEVALVRTRYASEVAEVDRQLGVLMQGLRDQGRYDDAMVVVTADHGESLGEGGRFWHGTTLAEEVIRVPLLVKLPHGERAGVRVPWQVRSIDLAPTLLDAAGGVAPPVWQGQELFPDRFDADLFLGAPPEDEPARLGWRAPDWSTHPASRDALSETDLEGFRAQALRRAGQKFVENLVTPRGDAAPALAWYDLEADPGELDNLAGGGTGSEAAIKASLESMVAERRRRGAPAGEPDASEIARLCAIGYRSGSECDALPGTR